MLKTIIGSIAIGLTLVGYIPYIKDLLAGKTKPHIYSWILWGFLTYIVFFLQISDQAGPGALVTLSAALLCTLVIVLTLVKNAKSEITQSDKVFLGLALLTLAFWLIAKQPLISAVLATTIELLGFVPTVRKSWKDPYSETLSFYWLNTLRFLLATLALSRYTIITALYPSFWFMANGLFALMLVYQRGQKA